MERGLIDFDIIKPPKNKQKVFWRYELFNFQGNSPLIFVSGKYRKGLFGDMYVIDKEGQCYYTILAWRDE